MIHGDGWRDWSIWEHSEQVKDLYERRSRLAAEEMTCAAQAAELLVPLVQAGDTVLDVGCGSGYFYHSLRTREVPVEYWGIDGSPSLIAIGKQHLPEHGLPPERLQVMRIEDLAGEADHVVCMNVLSNIDNYHRPLERLLSVANRTVILRESLKPGPSEYQYVTDEFLDPGRPLQVYVNHYGIDEVRAFISGYGFDVRTVVDRRTGGEPEMVIGYPHYWTFLVAQRRDPKAERAD